MPKGWNRAVLVAALTVGIATTLRPLAEQQSAADAEAAKFYIIDCLLPGQVRRVGNTTYMTPRRPIRTTAQDCAIRGGEYTEWDRADYQSALTVWLDAASTGDAQAMNYVGEIFEQGLGRDPDYVMAKYWYERAVAADFKPAMVNLASLYDTGRGVDRDAVMAINLYRQAWGIPEGEALLTQADSDAASAETESALAAVRAENEQLAAAAEAAREALQSESDRAAALAARARAPRLSAILWRRVLRMRRSTRRERYSRLLLHWAMRARSPSQAVITDATLHWSSGILSTNFSQSCPALRMTRDG